MAGQVEQREVYIKGHVSSLRIIEHLHQEGTSVRTSQLQNQEGIASCNIKDWAARYIKKGPTHQELTASSDTARSNLLVTAQK